jgi:hypothetical protein
MTLYLFLMYLVSLMFGYVLEFTGATLAIGKSLSSGATPRGYQDAVTPPWVPPVALATYAGVFVGVVYGFWEFGGLVGAGIVVGFLLVTAVNKAMLLPKASGPHFRKIIVTSMIYRHANFLRDGDTLRATVMGELLEKLGVPANDLVAEVMKKRDPNNAA